MAINLKNLVDKTIKLTGSLSEEPNQHIILSFSDRPNAYYFDIENGDQIVIYSSKVIPNATRIIITGTIISVGGVSKRPNSTQKYVEYHMLVNDWVINQKK